MSDFELTILDMLHEYVKDEYAKKSLRGKLFVSATARAFVKGDFLKCFWFRGPKSMRLENQFERKLARAMELRVYGSTVTLQQVGWVGTWAVEEFHITEKFPPMLDIDLSTPNSLETIIAQLSALINAY